MELDHRQIVHLVDVITRQDDNILWSIFFDGKDVLVDRVGRALIPMFVDPLLRRNDIQKLTQLGAKVLPPAEVNVSIQTERLVLR